MTNNNTQASQQVPSGIGESNPLTRFSYEESTRWLLRIYGQIEQLESENRQLRAVLAAQPSQAGGDGAKDAEYAERYRLMNSYAPSATSTLLNLANSAAIAAGKHKGE